MELDSDMDSETMRALPQERQGMHRRVSLLNLPKEKTTTITWVLGSKVAECFPIALGPLMKANFQFRDYEQFSFDPDTRYIAWKKTGKHWFQGEYNATTGEWHGRCMIIVPDKYVQLAVFRKGKCHGPFVIVTKKEIVTGTMTRGKPNGTPQQL